MKITRKPEEAICRECGVLTVTWEEQAIVNGRLTEIPCKRDYYPCSFMIHLKPETTTTYIVTQELESLLKSLPFHRIRPIDNGKFNYAIDVPLQKNARIASILDGDTRIDRWNTAASAPVCGCHANFVDKR